MVAGRLGAPRELADAAGSARGVRTARGARGADTGADALAFASAVLGAIRKKKSEEQKPLKTPAARVVVAAPAGQRALLAEVERDLRAAGLIERLESADAETLTVDVELATPRRRRTGADEECAVRAARSGSLPRSRAARAR